MLQDLDYDLLCRASFCLNNRKIYGDTIGIALGYVFKTNYFFGKIYPTPGTEKLTKLLSLFPEIKINHNELIEIEDRPKNGFYFSHTIIRDLSPIIGEIDVAPSTSEYPKNIHVSKLSLLRKARDWFQNGQVGRSSVSICIGAIFNDILTLEHLPWDVYDMNRCIKLVQYIPEIKDHIPFLINDTNISIKWKHVLVNLANEHNYFNS